MKERSDLDQLQSVDQLRAGLRFDSRDVKGLAKLHVARNEREGDIPEEVATACKCRHNDTPASVRRRF